MKKLFGTDGIRGKANCYPITPELALLVGKGTAKVLGADCGYYIPDRHTEGYGINFDALADIAEREFPDLIISVDCGITSCEEVRFAQEVLGIDMIITDHHEPPAELPDCPVFDPKLSAPPAYRRNRAALLLFSRDDARCHAAHLPARTVQQGTHQPGIRRRREG